VKLPAWDSISHRVLVRIIKELKRKSKIYFKRDELKSIDHRVTWNGGLLEKMLIQYVIIATKI